jgi:hypothetical protein
MYSSHRCGRAIQTRCLSYDSRPDIVSSGADSTLGFPDPFAVATLGGEQTKTTTVIKRTLNPYWNESFDLYVNLCC